MKMTIRTIGFGCALALALVPWLVAAQAAGQANQGKITGNTLIAASELKWTSLPGIAGAEQVMLWGDTTKGPHRAFFKFPVGLKAPLHTHTHGDRAVIVSGTLSLAVDGAPAKQLGPGSYFSIAAGTKHVTAVEGDQPCVFYIEREGPFDVVMVEEAGAKK
jgi:anti-sigma factor ChrR (cupin superfamily)